MIKFMHSHRDADAEDILENVNKYILLGNDNFELENFNYYRESILDELDIGLKRVNSSWNVSVYHTIIAKNKVYVFIKRVIRKLLSWLLIDITNQQIEFNRSVVDYLNHENDLIQILIKENEKLRESIITRIEEANHEI